VWSSYSNENWQGKPKYSENTCTRNTTLLDRGSKPNRHGEEGENKKKKTDKEREVGKETYTEGNGKLDRQQMKRKGKDGSLVLMRRATAYFKDL
jgi:hypothetical protein